jgi:transcriptional regulator with XRE-family HTH domain
MTDGDRPAVAAEVRQRMTARKVTTAELARRTALSHTTIRSIRQGKGAHRRSTLVTLAAGLGWPIQHLLELAAGEPPLAPQAVPLARLERKLDAVLGYLGIRAR